MMSRESDNALELLLGPLPLPPPPLPLRRSRGWANLGSLTKMRHMHEPSGCDVKEVSSGYSRDARAGKWDANSMNMTRIAGSVLVLGAEGRSPQEDLLVNQSHLLCDLCTKAILWEVRVAAWTQCGHCIIQHTDVTPIKLLTVGPRNKDDHHGPAQC
jgi:hypothetical protein